MGKLTASRHGRHMFRVCALALAALALTRAGAAPDQVVNQASPTPKVSAKALFTFVGEGALSNDRDLSRSQLVVAKSMDAQFRKHGLQSTVVLAGKWQGESPKFIHVTSLRADWSMEGFKLVRDDANGRLMQRYGLTKLPATVLVDADGRVQKRWDGFAPFVVVGPVLAGLTE
jgi:hypothetical protein